MEVQAGQRRTRDTKYENVMERRHYARRPYHSKDGIFVAAVKLNERE